MIRAGFLSAVDRADLIALARDGSATHRLARRANALVLLDAGWSCEKVAEALFVDDDTIRKWRGLFVEDGLEGLTRFDVGGSACQLSDEQQEKLKAWVAAALPRTTRQIGAWIAKQFGVAYEGRSGLIALLNRLGLEYHKPQVIPRNPRIKMLWGWAAADRIFLVAEKHPHRRDRCRRCSILARPRPLTITIRRSSRFWN
jgi:transposase